MHVHVGMNTNSTPSRTSPPAYINTHIYLLSLDELGRLLPGVPPQAGSIDGGELIPGAEGAILICWSAVEHLHRVGAKVYQTITGEP